MKRNSPEVNCNSCTAACCRKGMNISLSKTGVFLNVLSMPRKVHIPASDAIRYVVFEPTDHEPEGSIGELFPGYDYGELMQDCGNITPDNTCTIYDSPNRPRACATFEVGSLACLTARQNAGL
jgi:Fe-S-cluster containining protein